MELWQAAILGLVEGITEYLPISSTGHLIITADLLRLDNASPNVKDFTIIIQGGAILAVAGLYFPRFLSMLLGLIGRDPAGLRLFINLIIAFLPAALLGLAVHSWIEDHLFRAATVIAALIVGGLFMIALDTLEIAPRRRAAASGASPGRDISALTPAQALFIGLLQCIALCPGVSRSMMTIAGGVLAGLRPAAAAEFSFLLGMPTLLAATAYALYKNLSLAHKNHTPNLFDSLGTLPCLVGLLVAALSAAVAVKWLVAFLNNRGLAPFGYYRIALGLVLIALIVSGFVAL